ncbi:BA14K family protein [Chelativorans sp. YIM 93263]|uniref:BA14K family protein n=1 Tax=Chelativorans sp. YIM 93263 TaxID=2906648 RepID=UPI002379E0F7|nr:BA14K family protein [Chelativorans sp. YIM 93263]
MRPHHRYHGHRHHRQHWRPRSNFFLQFGVPVAPRYAPRPAAALSASHVYWCQQKYRSYRVSDNTFQPYHGPRKPCVSPYYP